MTGIRYRRLVWLYGLNLLISCVHEGASTTTTTTCIRNNLELFGTGCCRFDSFFAYPRGKQTEEACVTYCNLDSACIAADIKYPDPEDASLKENATFTCFSFYGSGHNFHTECGTQNYNERCYRKSCASTSTTTTQTTATTTTTGSLPEFYGYGCCRSNTQQALAMGVQTEAACLALCKEDPLCIAADIRFPDWKEQLEENVTYICYNFHGAGLNFHLACDNTSVQQRCYAKPEVKRQLKAVPTTFTSTTSTVCQLGALTTFTDGCCAPSDMGSLLLYVKLLKDLNKQQCKDACQQDTDCIAVDYRPVTRNGQVVYDCFNYFGDATDFQRSHASCRSDAYISYDCFKKSCDPVTITTTSTTYDTRCRYGNVSLYGTGCCDFTGFYARNFDLQTLEACEAYCNTNPECISADMRYVESNTAPVDGKHYLCRNYFGEANNFRNVSCLASGAYNPADRCYRKYCLTTTTTTTLCFPDLEFLGNGCCRFDSATSLAINFHAEPKGAQTEEACLAYCNEDTNCVAADIRYPDLNLPFLEENVTYVCHNFYGSPKAFHADCNTESVNERCYVKPCALTTTSTTSFGQLRR